MILFLVQANYKIGFGHLSRCTSIAQELKNFYKKKIIHGVDFKLKGIDLKCYDKIYSTKKNILEIIKKNKIRKIIIDKNINNEDFKKKLKTMGCKLIQLNHNFERYKYIDFVINYLAKNKKNKIFNNLKYLIIKKNIINKYKKFEFKKKTTILVCLGGGFNKKYFDKIFRIIQNPKFKKFNIIFILPNRSPIKDISLETKNIKFVINPEYQKLKKIYRNSNVGVSSGGLQLSEMIANRMNVLSVGKNKTEQKNINFFAQNGFCHATRLNDNGKIIFNKLFNIISDKYLREKIEKKIIKNFSLNGAENTANLIKKL